MENIKSLEDALQNPDLKETVQVDNKLKDFIVNFTGQQLNPENGEVTVEMVVEVLASHFPEMLFAVAEENFIRGYEQALNDLNNFSEERQDTSTPYDQQGDYNIEEYQQWKKEQNE
jgi:hypothetical protein